MKELFDFNRLPTESDRCRYVNLDEVARSQARLDLAKRRQMAVSPAVSVMALTLAAVAIISPEIPLWARSGLALLVTVFAALALYLIVADPARKARTWRELFEYTDSLRPTPQEAQETKARASAAVRSRFSDVWRRWRRHHVGPWSV